MCNEQYYTLYNIMAKTCNQDASLQTQFILDNENICRPKCITSERIGIVERKSANKYAREYKDTPVSCCVLGCCT